MATFQRGDIVEACLNPVAGQELQGDKRPCLVISPYNFNKLGLTIIIPITQGGNYARFAGFAVTLMGTGTQTQGVLLANGIRSIDLNVRQARKIEEAPTSVVNEILAVVSSILE
ncbi:MULTISPECIES: type II toxin-antitoxin system ChpB family toxin [Photorhabdus]|uniref:Type II toxin-antitoxin system ChpB family toxin n=2 Tax=Photorhabdus TaxID=29487 RepID=A0ABX0AYL3_9GAMM|nr:MULTISPECIES: type II toxin-antitoxin system ChpB family toxin [Photorhabdus]EYU13473.1 growth inhibitor [Photorhabdus aegyptia]MCC8376486.1 type II toxin-antitoxin system ChpB family toxin [Photorhabdus bodei]MCC8465003.1 type II toxin-antitoxin system ChpB family toxin [Photorhabdus bodei]MCT8351017.1 type II toxin-antitoxin system ChpB family toxin [Photorhabdus kayaii]MDB6369090.1 type II toxin-antitoxin system ChpB family toxin [Photorhabdus bodei]